MPLVFDTRRRTGGVAFVAVKAITLAYFAVFASKSSS